jgi:hypothetical protein
MLELTESLKVLLKETVEQLQGHERREDSGPTGSRGSRIRGMKGMKEPEAMGRDNLEGRPAEELVEIILKQQEMIQRLFEEVERLRQIINGDSRTLSKPPSGDLIKRSEKEKPVEPEKEGEEKREGNRVMKGERGKDLGE